MKITFTTETFCGNATHPQGSTIDVDERVAKRLIAGRHAVLETATAPTKSDETADLTPKKKK